MEDSFNNENYFSFFLRWFWWNSYYAFKTDNVDILMGSETDEIIEEIFESLLQNYQKDFEESMKGSEFAIDSVDLLHYHLQKTSL